MLLRLIVLLSVIVGLASACAGEDPAQQPAQQPAQPVALPSAQAPPQPSAQASAQESEQQAPQSAQPNELEASGRQEPADSTASDSETEAATQSEPVQPSAPPDDRALLPPPSFDLAAARRYLEHLAGVLGPRRSASDEEAAAAEYLAETFRSLGYEVELQPFSFTNPVNIVRIDLPDDESDFVFHFRGSAVDGVRAELVRAPGYGRAEDFAAIDAEGKIAVVERGLIEFRVKAANALAAGAAALIIVNDPAQPNSASLGAATFEIPVVMTARSLAEYEALAGEVVSIAAAAPSDARSQNVIARRADAVCRIVVGGHYDTVPGVAGANDNASGAALTLAFAEIWAGHPGVSEICFVGFGAEELGLHGSAAYVESLRLSGRLADLSAMLNLDAIGDGRAPYIVIASPALRPLANRLIDALQVNAQVGVQPNLFGSDHEAFASAGKEVVFVFPPGAVLHTPADNLDNLDWSLYEDVARLNHAILACLLERVGGDIAPAVPCSE